MAWFSPAYRRNSCVLAGGDSEFAGRTWCPISCPISHRSPLSFTLCWPPVHRPLCLGMEGLLAERQRRRAMAAAEEFDAAKRKARKGKAGAQSGDTEGEADSAAKRPKTGITSDASINRLVSSVRGHQLFVYRILVNVMHGLTSHMPANTYWPYSPTVCLPRCTTTPAYLMALSRNGTCEPYCPHCVSVAS